MTSNDAVANTGYENIIKLQIKIIGDLEYKRAIGERLFNKIIEEGMTFCMIFIAKL